MPFDLSRLAIGHDSARPYTPPKKKRPEARTDNVMHGGFTLEFVAGPPLPRIQVRHLNKRVSLIRFATPKSQPRTRSEQRRKTPGRRPGAAISATCTAWRVPCTAARTPWPRLPSCSTPPPRSSRSRSTAGRWTRPTSTICAPTSRSPGSASRHWPPAIASFGLSKTGVQRIYSEASIGKAVLRQMNVAPWRVPQPDFPDHLLGLIMSTYYGGRSEVRIRRQVVRVLYCDFLSMYPTVCKPDGPLASSPAPRA